MAETTATVEVLKVWYSVFCTLMDGDDYDDAQLIAKLRQLRAKLTDALPEVEAVLRRERQ